MPPSCSTLPLSNAKSRLHHPTLMLHCDKATKRRLAMDLKVWGHLRRRRRTFEQEEEEEEDKPVGSKRGVVVACIVACCPWQRCSCTFKKSVSPSVRSPWRIYVSSILQIERKSKWFALNRIWICTNRVQQRPSPSHPSRLPPHPISYTGSAENKHV